jgi:hypothetical protein
MRILLVLTCCVGLAFFAGAAQPDEQGNNQGKKKGAGNAPSQQVAAPQTGKVYKTGPGGGPHNANVQYNAGNKKAKWQGPVTGQTQTNVSGNANVNTKFGKKNKFSSQTDVSGNAANTKFNKGKFSSQTNVGGNVKFQKKHFNLANNPNQKYQAVKFNQNYKIAGANKWKGSKYQVFVNYQPQWHDQWWWSHHHNHIVFVFGAPYYWDTGYWYPAWGYDPGANYYYDGPIYASNPEEDPGQVVANVQSALQQQGYYQGEVDGILGPQTRAALAEYQSAQGLEPTGTVDEPTLETLGMV